MLIEAGNDLHHLPRIGALNFAARNSFYFDSTEIMEWLKERGCDWKAIGQSPFFGYIEQNSKAYNTKVLKYLSTRCNANSVDSFGFSIG